MTLELSINGRYLDGFESGSLALTMEEPVNTFSVEYMSQTAERSIAAGDFCEVYLDGLSAIQGYVDSTEDDEREDLITLRASGRSVTCDLVDCAAITKPLSWESAQVSKIVADLCSPFELAVTVDGDEGARLASFAVQRGESVMDAIVRAAMKRGLFAFSHGESLKLARAGARRSDTILRRGWPVQRARRSEDWTQRFSQYVFRGQGRPLDPDDRKKATHLVAAVEDPEVTRYRPTHVTAEAHDRIDLETRAHLEKNQRAGRGQRLALTLDGWTDRDSKLWQPNTLVRVEHDLLNVSATMLIVQASYSLGANEARATELQLCRPEAFDLGKWPALTGVGAWTD